MKLNLIKYMMLLLLPVLAAAASMGELQLFVFKDGKPVSNNEVIIDATSKFKTDSDGYLSHRLEVGVHQLQIISKDKDNKNLAYLKKSFTIVESKSTQLLVTLKENEKIVTNTEMPEGFEDSNTTAKKDIVEKKLGFAKVVFKVLSSEDKKPIADARVFVKGSDTDGVSDKDGVITLNVEEGIKTFSIIHSKFSSRTISDINITADATLEQTIELTPASMELEEFIVLAPSIEGTVASVMMEEKKSTSVTNILSSEQMSKKGDGNAAAALKRVAGLTLVDGKNVYVRGLGERYSNVEMNGLPLPSPDPTKRVVPLDIFPSNVIGSLKVQKSATADIPASFGGGYIDVRTKNAKSSDYMKISLGLGGNSNTGKSVYEYEGSKDDWSGYDDGYRDISPTIFQYYNLEDGLASGLNDEQNKELLQSYINRKFNFEKNSLPMNFSAGFESVQNFSIGSEDDLTLSFNYEYSQKHKYRKDEKWGYNYNEVANSYDDNAIKDGFTEQTTSTYSHGGMINLAYNPFDFLNLKWTTMYMLDSEKLTKFTQNNDYQNNEYVNIYNLNWEERELFVNQLSLAYKYSLFEKDAEFDFAIERASTELNQPGNYEYLYAVPEGLSDIYAVDMRSDNHKMSLLNSKDDVDAFMFKNKQFLELLSEEDYLEFGYKKSTKNRDTTNYNFRLDETNEYNINTYIYTDIDTLYEEQILSDIDAADMNFVFSANTNDASNFVATVEDNTKFVSLGLNPIEDLSVMYGMQFVDLVQSIRVKTSTESESFELKESFPSLNLKYRLDEDNIFDIATSTTYIVPDLREFSAGSFTHPYEAATILGGNTEAVRTKAAGGRYLDYTEIKNYDFQYSHYFSSKENMKFSLFYKEMQRPIEDVRLQPNGPREQYTFVNTKEAKLKGFEIDFRKYFDFISECYENFYLSGNYSYNDSEVKLYEDQTDYFTTNNRPLQGLSKTVINMTFGYENDDESIVLVYNKMGERIRMVGTNDSSDKQMDTIEIPAQVLDFVWSTKLSNGIGLKLKLQNILDEETIWMTGDKIIRSYKKGKAYSLSASYKF
ncbi:MAG: TonB-dependent receptor plug domain-containing protein [Campylobacterales bacterium]|nr:TonB-dependent receptor plug domain-containing protein [Campylobacterales bacterium]